MAKSLLMDELHIAARAPRGLPEAEYSAIRQTLYGSDFQAGLRRAVRDVFRRHPELSKVRVTVAR